MARIPFVTDNVKKYLRRIATSRICGECEYFCSSGCEVVQKSIKLTCVEDVQDLFDVTFKCPRLNKCLKISKFFLPNTNFERDYLESIAKLSEFQMNIKGRKVLDELLRCCRLETKM